MRARIINLVIWLYLWLSQALLPVTTDGDFWTEKGKQLFRLNPHFNDLARLLGNGLPLFVLWFAIHWALAKRQTKVIAAKDETTTSERIVDVDMLRIVEAPSPKEGS